MNILILGNGFDLAHGLPTSYTDFLDFAKAALAIYNPNYDSTDANVAIRNYSTIYLDSWEDNRPSVQNIKEQLKNLFKNREIKYVTNSSNRKVFVNEELDEFNTKLRDNVWYNYIGNLPRSRKNWVDFEKEIAYIIGLIDDKYISLEQKFSTLRDSIIDDNNHDISKELKEKCRIFSARYKQCCDNRNRQLGNIYSLRDRLYDDLEDFSNAFEFYLSRYVEPKIENADCLPLFKDTLHPNYIISFNYTRTYEKLYLNTDEESDKICHIHGVCGKDNIVLGINEYLPEKEQSQKTDFAIFKKFIQRIRKHTDVSYATWAKMIEEQNSKLQSNLKCGKTISEEEKEIYCSNIYIFGHSLDVTDKDILRRFLMPAYTKICIYSKTKAAEGKLIENLLRIMDEETVITKSTSTMPISRDTMLKFRIPRH